MPIHKNKTVWLLVAMKNNCLLLKKNFHEGRDILQLPGSSSKKDFNILVSNLFGIRYIDQLTDFGVIQNTIVKTDEIVDLHINICRLDITDQHGIDFGDNYEWCSKEMCISDKRGKRDSRLHSRLFENHPVSLNYTEEQLNGWYDAKITSWKENSLL